MEYASNDFVICIVLIMIFSVWGGLCEGGCTVKKGEADVDEYPA